MAVHKWAAPREICTSEEVREPGRGRRYKGEEGERKAAGRGITSRRALGGEQRRWLIREREGSEVPTCLLYKSSMR